MSDGSGWFVFALYHFAGGVGGGSELTQVVSFFQIRLVSPHDQEPLEFVIGRRGRNRYRNSVSRSIRQGIC